MYHWLPNKSDLRMHIKYKNLHTRVYLILNELQLISLLSPISGSQQVPEQNTA